MIRVGVCTIVEKSCKAMATRSHIPSFIKVPPRSSNNKTATSTTTRKCLVPFKRLSSRLTQQRCLYRRNATLRSSWSKRLATLVTKHHGVKMTYEEKIPSLLSVGPTSRGSKRNKPNQQHSYTSTTSSTYCTATTLWIEQAQSIPNLITMSRIASAPLLGYFIATEQLNMALIGCGLAGLSDWLDGHIARKYHLETKLGSYLDPLGDKVVINIVAVSLLWTPSAIPLPVVSLWLSKDLLLVLGTVLRLRQQQTNVEEPTLIQATAISKINTGLQFATLAVAVSQTMTESAFGLLMPLCYLTSCTTVASIFSYRHQAFPGLSAGLIQTSLHQRCASR